MKHSVYIKWLILPFIFIAILQVSAQDPHRFEKAVNILNEKVYNFDEDKELVVFAGSSSIAMWKDVQSAFPEYNVINHGFGGSHFSDLLFYYEDLVLKPRPDILFIYEGDNDIVSGKKAASVIKEAKQLVSKIRADLPQTRIVLISVKPSPARMKFKKEYIKLNRMLKKLAGRTDRAEFADVWGAMFNKNGEVVEGVFLDDNVHMNAEGYKIWIQVLGRHLAKTGH